MSDEVYDDKARVWKHRAQRGGDEIEALRKSKTEEHYETAAAVLNEDSSIKPY